MKANDSIKKLKNIGPNREKEFNEINIFTIEDLIYFFPKSYKSREHIKSIVEIQPEEVVNIIGTIKGFVTNFNGTKNITKVKVSDNTGDIICVFNNQPYIKNTLKLGVSYMITGKVVLYNNIMLLSNPEYEKESNVTDAILPYYKFSSQKIIRKIIKGILTDLAIEDFMPNILKEKLGLKSFIHAVNNIHFPDSNKDLELAQKFFATEELLILQLKLFTLRCKFKKSTTINISLLHLNEIIEKIGFELTSSQKKALNEIVKDLQSGSRMYRLLQGDVGSGKTIIAIIASFLVAKIEYQVAVMVPTEILAKQHLQSFTEILTPLGISVQLLTANIKDRSIVSQNIKNGSANVIVATHAAISENISFKNLGLVITDEQHRFGVAQREALAKKGNNPHVMVISATPIPRTLALILYGDLDISTIEGLPKGRKPISTYCVNTSFRNRVWDFIEKEADKGYQSFIVCPSIDGGMEMTSVLDYKEIVKNYYKSKKSDLADKVACLHGKMSSIEKETIIEGFRNGDYLVLVATTVVEVGVNLPCATVMVVEDAYRFGLSQLHQLRGRVGRGQIKSYCILISNNSVSRLKALVNNSDGFKLAQLDLEQRGPGDFFGLAQHGIIRFKIANLQRDIKIIKEVKQNINEIHKELEKNILLYDKVKRIGF